MKQDEREIEMREEIKNLGTTPYIELNMYN